MRTTVKVFSIIAVVLGSMAILNSFSDTSADAGYGFFGGALFLAQGIVTLVYIKTK